MNQYKRWYDYDPLMLKVINILKDYPNELKEQAQEFLNTIEEKVSKETIDKFYSLVRQFNGGSRWYDKDPVISKTIELLRVVPQTIQRQTAQSFIQALQDNGIKIEE